MIPRVADTVLSPQAHTGQPVPVADITPKKAASPVELPREAVEAAAKADRKAINRAAEQINDFIRQFDRDLQFAVDEETGASVVKVIDTQTREVIRQMPTEEMLAIAKALHKLQGLLIKEKA